MLKMNTLFKRIIELENDHEKDYLDPILLANFNIC